MRDGPFIFLVIAVAVFLIAMILLCMPESANATTTTITSLPYTANQTGTAYSETLVVQGTRLESATNGVNFTGHDIVFKMGTDTILFGTGLGDATSGIQFNTGAYNIRVDTGWVIHGYAPLDSLDFPDYNILTDGVDAIRFAGAYMNANHNIELNGVNVKVGGDNAHAYDYMVSPSDSRANYLNKIKGGKLWSFCRRYTDRQYYDGAVIRLESSLISNIYIDDVLLFKNSHDTLVYSNFSGWGPYGNNPPSGWTISDSYNPFWDYGDWAKVNGPWTAGDSAAEVSYRNDEPHADLMVSAPGNYTGAAICSLSFVAYFDNFCPIVDDTIFVLGGLNGSTWADTLDIWTTAKTGGTKALCRHAYDISAFASGQSSYYIGFKYVLHYDATDYAYWISGVTIETGPGQGMRVGGGYGTEPGSSRIRVDACTVSVDHRNDFYTVPGGVGQSSENAYGIFMNFVSGAGWIMNNVIRSGTAHGGGRGIAMESVRGAEIDSFDVAGNDVDIHEGPNVRVGETLGSTCFRMRDLGGVEGWIHVYDNTFRVTGDSIAATSSYGHIPEAVKLGVQASSVPSHILIERNVIQALARPDSVAGNCEAKAFSFDPVDAGGIDSTLVIRNNRFESDHIPVAFPSTNIIAYSYGDTVKDITPHLNFSTFYLGTNGNDWTNHGIVQDYIFEGEATDTNIVFANSGTLDIYVRKTLTIHVVGNNDLPVYAAACTVWNDYGTIVLTGVTDSLGRISGVAPYWYESRAAADSTGFNPFTVHAQKSTTKAAGDYTVTWDNGDTTLSLDVAGSGWPDTLNFCFMHQSVGNVIVGSADILDSVAQIYEVVGNHYSVVRFWHYLTNSVGRGLYGPDDASTLISSDEYGWIQSDPGPFFVIGYSIASSPQLYYVWQDDSNTEAWDLVSEIRVPYPAIDDSSDVQLYVIQKPPYHQWYAPDGPPTERTPTPERMAALKSYYEAIRDTVMNHPEVRFVVAGGTPLVLQTTGPADFKGDTSLAKIVYEFQWWFADTFDASAATNFWKQDNGYIPFCETSPDSANRYCLKSALSSGDSHPNITGGGMMQDSLVSFMARLAQDILQKTYGEEEPPPPPPTVDPLNYCLVDTAHNDAVGELDTVLAIWSPDATGTGDSVWLAVSTSGYPDSSGATWQPFVAGVIDTLKMTVSLTEPGYVYMSAGVKEGELWSARSQDNRYFNTAPPPVSEKRFAPVWREP